MRPYVLVNYLLAANLTLIFFMCVRNGDVSHCPATTYLYSFMPRTATESASSLDRACQNTMRLLKHLAEGAGFELTSFSDDLTACMLFSRTPRQIAKKLSLIHI